MSLRDARGFDLWLRKNRAVSTEMAVEELAAASPAAREAFAAMDAGDMAGCVRALVDRARLTSGKPGTSVDEAQMKAL